MSRLTTAVLVLSLALSAACGDEGGPGPSPIPVADSGTPRPPDSFAPSQQDGETTLPPTPPTPPPASLWSCTEIGACADQCGINQGCMNQCATKGCASAKSAFNALNSCGASKCMFACMVDPASAGCESCINTSCGAELQACMSNKC